jgi:Na+/melibiose symporter-like transporter
MSEPHASHGVKGKLTPLAILLYASGSVGTGVFNTVPTVLLLYYCTETLGMAAAYASIVVFLPKAWSILWDPLVGAWSDRARSPWGRRRPFLIIGAVGVVGAFIAVFHTPSVTPLSMFLWVATSYFALATFFSLFAVPYTALPAEMTDQPSERSALVASRMTLAMVGVLIGASLAPALVDRLGAGREGYAGMSLIVAGLCGAAMLGPVFMLKGRDRSASRQENSEPIWKVLGLALKNASFRYLALTYLLQASAAGALTASVPYFVSRVLGRPEGDIGIAMGVMLLATIAATPLWAWLGRRIGDGWALAIGAALYALAVAGLGLAGLAHLSFSVLLLIFAAIGVPFAATMVLPFVLVAHLAHEQSRSGARTEGAFTGAWTATEKLGLAFGPMLVGGALTLIGQDLSAGLPVFIAIAPPLLLLLSLPCLWAARTQRGSSSETTLTTPSSLGSNSD